MLEIKQKPGKKHRKASNASDFDLFLGTSRVTRSQVSKAAVIDTFKKLKAQNDANNAEVAEKTEQMKSEVDNQDFDPTILEFPNSRILDNFRWTQQAVEQNKFIIDEDSFMIRNEYLPKDDDAPARVCDIAKDICKVFEQYYDAKAKAAEQVDVIKRTAPNGTFHMLESVEDGEIVLSQMVNGELIPVDGNCSTQDVIKTLFWIKVQKPRECGQILIADVTVPATGKVPELTFTVEKDGKTTTDLSKLSGEVLHVFEELMPKLLPTG